MLLLWLGSLCLLLQACSQELLTVNAVCSAEACYTVHLQRKFFNDAWRSCRERGGNLASIKSQEEAELVQELLLGLLVSGEQGQLKLWLGLQRQPRQCSSYKPLRGFTWTTGDQDTQYTNWLKGQYPGSCPATRCVVLSYGTGEDARYDNYKWLEGSCLLAVDGYLCRFAYRGMCDRIELGAGGTVSYATPFGVTSAHLRHVPFGSVASLPCGGPRGAQSLLCMARSGEEAEERGRPGGASVAWSRDPPFCQEPRPRNWCEDNGGCQHTCVDEGAYYHCRCDEGYQLATDGRSCAPLDDCASGPCQFYCSSRLGGFLCSCPAGYRLAEDGRSCLDVDECSLVLCDHTCVNTPGTFFCRCDQGYQLEDGECRDVDECVGTPCDQLCANTEGSFQCYCEVGFTLSEDNATTCTDVDECQYQGTCEQMCVNYLGHFECHCEEGYTLDLNSFSCNPSADPYPPVTLGVFTGDLQIPQTETPGWEDVLSTQEEWETEAGAVVPSWRVGGATPTLWAQDMLVPERPLAGDPSPTLPETAAERTTHSTARAAKAKGAGATHGGEETLARVPTDHPKGERQAFEPGAPTWPEQGAEEPVGKSRGLPGRQATTTTSPAQTTGADETLPLPRTVPTLKIRPTGNTSGDPDAHRESWQQRDDRWLLIALLVPICLFVVVMLALAIVYCTRCACGKSRNVTDCYRWINNSSKAAAPDPASSNMNTTVWETQAIWRTDVTHV